MVIINGPIDPVGHLNTALEAAFGTASKCLYGGAQGNCFSSEHHFLEYLPPLMADSNLFTLGRLTSRTPEAELWLLANLPPELTAEIREDPR